MGCDIHMAVEHRKNGKWERVLPPEHARDPWLKENDWLDDWAVEWYSDRNYTLFGVLAGVRSRDDLAPIAEPRGFPQDPSDAVQRRIADDGMDRDLFWLGDHSHTWLTLDEILAYDWDQPRLRERCGDFLTRTVPALQELDPDATQVRLVFGFDS